MVENDFIADQIKKEKIDAKDLLRDIKLLIKDNIVVKMYEQGQELSLTFLNGQKFILTLYEINNES